MSPFVRVGGAGAGRRPSRRVASLMTVGGLLFASGVGTTCASAPSAQDAQPAPRSAVTFVRVGDSIPPDLEIEALIAPYRSRISHLADVLVEATGAFVKSEPEGTLENLVADAVLHVARQRSSDTVHAVLVNDGGLRVPLAPGPVLVRHTYELLPFENYITVLSLSGDQMERLADEIARTNGEPIAGWSMVLDGSDATDVLVGGQPIDPDGQYRLATVDYLADGGGSWSVLWEAAQADSREDLDVLIRDVFIEYLREQSVVSPTLDGRVRRKGETRQR